MALTQRRPNTTMSDKKELTFDEAVAMLPDGDYVHTFRNPGGMLVGADWKREKILEALKAGSPELSGDRATRMNHGIHMIHNGSPLFIQTKES